MKTTQVFSVLILSLTIGLTSCKSKEKANSNKEIGKILQELPCEDKGRSDKKFFRAHALATSSDLSTASEKALILAKQRLVTLISSNTKTVTDRYVNEREMGDAAEFEQKFENLTREVAEETINNVVVACEKKSVLDGGKYRAFIAVEVSKDDVLNGVNNRISNDAKLQVDYDKMKFQEIFNQEMEQLEKERTR